MAPTPPNRIRARLRWLLPPLLGAILAPLSGPALAAEAPPAGTSEPVLPEEMQASFREVVREIALGQLREAKVSQRGLAVFGQASSRAMALVPLKDLVRIETTLSLSLLPGEEDAPAEGQMSVMVLFNAAAISTLYGCICREALPQLNATDRARAEPVCTTLGVFAPAPEP